MKDAIISEAMRRLVAKRNKKYGKKWRSENARKMSLARWEKAKQQKV